MPLCEKGRWKAWLLNEHHLLHADELLSGNFFIGIDYRLSYQPVEVDARSHVTRIEVYLLLPILHRGVIEQSGNLLTKQVVDLQRYNRRLHEIELDRGCRIERVRIVLVQRVGLRRLDNRPVQRD